MGRIGPKEREATVSRTTSSKIHQLIGEESPALASRFGAVLVQSARDLLADSGPQWAAAIAYYCLLSAFPLLLLVAALASYFIDPQWAVDQATKLLGGFLPENGTTIQGIIHGVIAARGMVGLLSGVVLLWTSSLVFGTLIKALDVTYDVARSYSFLKRFLIQLVMVLSIGPVFLVALISSFLFDLLWQLLQVVPAHQVVFQLSTWLVRGLLLLAAFWLIYRLVPHQKPSGQAALAGAIIASFLVLIARPLFLVYLLEQFGHYNLVYGSLAIAITLLLWIWIVALITLYGGEVASHTQAMLNQGHSTHEVGQRDQEHSPPDRTK
jgi:membrane protein